MVLCKQCHQGTEKNWAKELCDTPDPESQMAESQFESFSDTLKTNFEDSNDYRDGTMLFPCHLLQQTIKK